MNINIYAAIVLSLISFKGRTQEIRNNSIKEFNGIFIDINNDKSYHLFYNGHFLFFYVDESNKVDNSLTRHGSYGFFFPNIDTDNLISIKLNNTGSLDDKFGLNFNNGGVLGYEYELGDRSLNLYNQNAFFYEKLYTLSPKIIADLRIKVKNKKINIDDFIYSYETVRSSRAIIYEKPNIATKMYLIKGNKIKIIGENLTWLKFVYNGKKMITGWIKKSELE
ncbi:hypothetical protein D3C87_284250 [compost metagenome]